MKRVYEGQPFSIGYFRSVTHFNIQNQSQSSFATVWEQTIQRTLEGMPECHAISARVALHGL
jgi:hypothetical protein